MKLFRCLLPLLILFLLTLPASAAELPEELTAGVDPAAGVDAEIVEEIGAFDPGEAIRFDRRFLALLQGCLRRWNLLGLDDALRTAGLILGAVVLCGLAEPDTAFGRYAGTAACLVITAACVGDLRSMMGLGVETVRKLHTYIRLLLPGLVTLMTVSGSGTGAGALYAGAVLVFDCLLALLDRLLIPLIYLYAGLSAAEAVLGQGNLEKLRDLVHWTVTTLLKWILYGFSAYLTFTGLFAGAADAQKARTLRMALAGMLPVVGGMVSEASNALVSAAALLRSSVGLYGLLAVIGLSFGPFLRLGFHYLLLKLTAAVSGLFGRSPQTALTERLCGAFGMILGVTGVCCILTMLILTLCVRMVTV